MARNGSGTMTPSVDFTTEAASPPIEISKLDTVLDDIATELTNSIAADGQTNPTANLKMNGFKLTNVGAPTALTDAVTATTVIDQELHYFVDSGSANTYVITPSPAIAAYEEGQRFVVRIANANSGASTLNVNGLGAIAIQTPDAVALASGALVAGGIYEFTYDANTSPDRWVMTSCPSDIPDGMLSSNVPLKDAANTFTSTVQALSNATNPKWRVTDGTITAELLVSTGNGSYVGTTSAHEAGIMTGGVSRLVADSSGNFNFKAGAVTSNNASASEVGFKGVPQNSQSDDYTCVLTDANKHIFETGATKTITIPANASVAYPVGTTLTFVAYGVTTSIAITSDTMYLSGTATTGTRTLTAGAGVATATALKVQSTVWVISGSGLT